MGSDYFRGDPVSLENAGKQICGQRSVDYSSVTEGVTYDFKENFLKIYNIIDKLVNEDYLDPAARAIATNIEGYKPKLEAITQVMIQYGLYCFNSCDTVIQNQDDNIASIPGGVN